MINFTREMIHDGFCNLPYEEKLKYAIICAQNDVSPQDVEEIIFSLCKGIEPVANSVIDITAYWTKERDKNDR